MAKSKRPHIKQSYFKTLRNWFSSLGRKLCCISKVENDDGDGVYEDASSQPQGKPTIDLRHLLNATSQKYNLPSDGCGCEGIGEHPVAPAASAHTALEETEVSPQPSSSSPTLAKTSEEEVLPLPDCRKTILGKYHQGNIPSKWNPSKYAGTQCTTTSFTAIVASAVLPTGLWTSRTINRIVRLGDRLHNYLIDNMSSAPGSHYLAADEMPKSPVDTNYIWPVQCTQSQEIQGLLYPDASDVTSLRHQLTWELFPGQPLRELGDALGRCLREDVQGCIITLDNRSSAVFRNPLGEYQIFDSHARDIMGGPHYDGKASLLRFSSLNEVVAYFRDMTVRETGYSLTGFKVELSG